MDSLNICVYLTLFSWGLWGIIDKKALNHARPEGVMLRLYLLSFCWIPISFAALNYFEPHWKLNSEVLLWTFLASFSYTVALLAYMAAMSVSEASFVLGITAGYPLIFQFLAHFFLHEALVPQRLLGALIIGLGLFLISGSAGSAAASSPLGQSSRKQLMRTSFYIVVATLTWGIYGLFDKKAVTYGSPLLVFSTKVVWDFMQFFLLLLVYRLCKKKIDWQNRMAWRYCGISELMLGAGGLSYLAAMSMASASYVISITGCYPLVMYLFALWLLKEQFNKLRFAGILLVVLGGAFVQLTAG